MTPSEYIAKLEDYLLSVKEQIEELKSKQQAAQQETSGVLGELAEAKDNLASYLKEYDIEKNKIDEKTRILRQEFQKLSSEIETLVLRKGELQLANERLQSQNRHFLEYEEKAIKVLRATEDSLIQREKEVQRREQFKTTKNILPPLN